MSLVRLVITAVVVEGRSQSAVARHYGLSRFWVHQLVLRSQREGPALPILNPDLPDWAATTCRWVAWAAWALFVADDLARLLLATNRRSYILRQPST